MPLQTWVMGRPGGAFDLVLERDSLRGTFPVIHGNHPEDDRFALPALFNNKLHF